MYLVAFTNYLALKFFIMVKLMSLSPSKTCSSGTLLWSSQYYSNHSAPLQKLNFQKTCYRLVDIWLYAGANQWCLVVAGFFSQIVYLSFYFTLKIIHYDQSLCHFSVPKHFSDLFNIWNYYVFYMYCSIVISINQWFGERIIHHPHRKVYLG